jgi:hypothetical protein
MSSDYLCPLEKELIVTCRTIVPVEDKAVKLTDYLEHGETHAGYRATAEARYGGAPGRPPP